MSKTQVKKINHEPIPDIPSFLFFVFQKNNNNEFVVIDGDKKIIKNILNKHNCKYIDRKNRIVRCGNIHSSSLLSKLQYFQDQSVLKFAHVPHSRNKTRSVKTHSKCKVYVGNSKKPIKIDVPNTNSKYSKSPIKIKKGELVKISAKTVDEVARVAKLLDVTLCTFKEQKGTFIGIHEKQ